MQKIYFESRCIVICTPDEAALADPNSVEFHLGDKLDIYALVGMFEASSTLSKIYILSEETGTTYKRLCSAFKEVNAGAEIGRASCRERV